MVAVSTHILGHFRYQLFQLPVTFKHGRYWVTMGRCITLNLGLSRYQLFKLATYFYEVFMQGFRFSQLCI